MSDFKAFYQGLPSADRKRFAEAAGTSTAYIEVHLIPRRKIPKPPLMGRLADACRVCGGHLTQDDLLAFFYRTESTTPAAA